MYVILLCPCAWLASARPPLEADIVVGWQQGHLALLALDHAQKWRSTHSLSAQHQISVRVKNALLNQIRHNTRLKANTAVFPSRETLQVSVHERRHQRDIKADILFPSTQTL